MNQKILIVDTDRKQGCLLTTWEIGYVLITSSSDVKQTICYGLKRKQGCLLTARDIGYVLIKKHLSKGNEVLITEYINLLKNQSGIQK